MTKQNGGTLASALSDRLEQLGMSKRELSRRTGLSRQTLHNVIVEGATNLKPSTCNALDKTLKWVAGTTAALASGDQPPIDRRTRQSQLQRIQVRLACMSEHEIELTLIMLEEHDLGSHLQEAGPAA